jgi:glucose/arabinose dehydrogenase
MKEGVFMRIVLRRVFMIVALAVLIGGMLPAISRGQAGVEAIAGGLEIPWAIAIAPDGRIFLTERAGRIRVIRDGRLEAQPYFVVPDVAHAGEGGLLGLALHPDFARTRFLYVYHTYLSDGRLQNRVVRLVERDGRPALDRVILDAIPGWLIHDGGRIKFGPDGKLYIGTGDASNGGLAQNRASLAGKILRVNDDGSVPPDNPFPGSPVYSLGHRNVQGLAWHPVTRRLYATEHGPSGIGSGCCRDEVNLIEAGKNYGWPVVTMAPGDPRFVDPVIHSGPEVTWAPSGAAFVSGGAWQNTLLFATLRGRHLHRVIFNDQGTRVVRDEKLFEERFGRLRDVVEAPDGTLYVLTSNRDGRGSPVPEDDRVLRMTPPR